MAAEDELDIPFCQYRSLQDKLLPQREVGNLQILQQFMNDVPCIIPVAHGEEQVQSTPSNADICVLQACHNARLMPEGAPRISSLIEQCACQNCPQMPVNLVSP